MTGRRPEQLSKPISSSHSFGRHLLPYQEPGAVQEPGQGPSPEESLPDQRFPDSGISHPSIVFFPMGYTIANILLFVKVY